MRDKNRIPLTMTVEQAQEIARGLRWLALSYGKAGMRYEAAEADLESQKWEKHADFLRGGEEQ